MILSFAANPAVDYVSVVSFRRRSTLRSQRSLAWPGGSGVHAAAVARTLGAEAKVVAFVAGHNGARFAELVAEHDLQLRAIPVTGETRITFSLLDEHDGNVCDVTERGPYVSQAAVGAMRRVLDAELPGTSTLIVSGSLPEGCSPKMLSDLVTAGRAAGARVLVDLAGPELEQAIAAAPWLIKPSLEELTADEGSEPGAQQLVERCADWHEAGVENACVSLGDRGLLWSTSQQLVHLAFRGQQPAYNSIGCGDTLVGAVAASVDLGANLQEALVTGVAAATANLGHIEPGYCDASEVAHFAAATTVTRVSVAELADVLARRAPVDLGLLSPSTEVHLG